MSQSFFPDNYTKETKSNACMKGDGERCIAADELKQSNCPLTHELINKLLLLLKATKGMKPIYTITWGSCQISVINETSQWRMLRLTSFTQKENINESKHGKAWIKCHLKIRKLEEKGHGKHRKGKQGEGITKTIKKHFGW